MFCIAERKRLPSPNSRHNSEEGSPTRVFKAGEVRIWRDEAQEMVKEVDQVVMNDFIQKVKNGG
jgi:hypothetical protein